LQNYVFLLPNFSGMSLFHVKDIYHECLSFFLHPTTYWQQIKAGKSKGAFGFGQFFLPGLLVAFVFIILGDLIFHSRYGFMWKDSLIKASRRVLFLFLLITFSIMVIRIVLQQFHMNLRMGTVKKIAVFSLSPAIITTICTGLLPFLDLGGIAPWYGFFLAYFGFETFFQIQEEKKFYVYFALFMAVFSLIMILTFTLNRISAYLLF
jgi:hypothetical protein